MESNIREDNMNQLEQELTQNIEGLGRYTKAVEIAYYVHGNQKDKQGVPYYEHVKRVAQAVRLRGGGEDRRIVAFLHDVVEDSDVTIEFIAKHFGLSVAKSVDYLTRKPEVSNSYYYELILQDKDAFFVKLADTYDNLGRMYQLPLVDQQRLTEKYSSGLAILLTLGSSYLDRS